MIFLGIGFMVLWLFACVVWAVMSLPGGLMANDSGAFVPERQMAMLAGLAFGQLVVLGAGIPGGMAFFMEERRGTLIWTLLGLLSTGVLIQIASVAWFFTFGRR